MDFMNRYRRISQNGGKVLTDELAFGILSVVEEIPYGRVCSYGRIAKLIGRDKNSRLVGKVLSMAEFYGDFPCHRVVNSSGRCAPNFTEQRFLLESEGVEFRPNGNVDMKKYEWRGE
ncbi:MAG: MGMT family protein [Clostridia bacterium]|nr:MGMT family protein [Clostridia bacterium]